MGGWKNNKATPRESKAFKKLNSPGIKDCNMRGLRLAMANKHWTEKTLIEQSEHEDEKIAKLMKSVANSLGKCGSRTIFDLAWSNYNRLCEKDVKEGNDWTKRKTPNVEEYVEWRGEQGKGNLATIGLAKCKRISCPLCCLSRSFLRRNNALEWAKEINWNEYYAVSLTFTVSHKLDDSSSVERFKKVLDNLNTSLSSFSNWIGRTISKINKGYISSNPESIGFISSLECTFGKNGLHPHFHTIFFTKSKEDVEKLRVWFKKDRVRVWKKSGGSLLRMPDINEDKSFQILVSPNEKSGPEKILSYINKGLFETISFTTKDKTKSKTSKNIFNLSKEELKYYCVFFEATRGKRFYRSGGICKQIKGISQQIKEFEEGTNVDIFNRKMKTFIRLESKKSGTPEGWLSEFVKENQHKLEKKAVNMEGEKIKDFIKNEWLSFIKNRFKEMEKDINFSYG